MARKKKAEPQRIVGKEKELSLSERLVSMSQESVTKGVRADKEERQRRIRKLVEDAKSFLALGSEEGEKLEVYRSDGGLYIHYDDLDFYPANQRSVYLVWPCPKCGLKTASSYAVGSWDELGALIQIAAQGRFTPHEGHQCDEELEP
ncbi:MAG TPA: hypothetical protein VNA25_19575 [Phycisphaerae bacterium]|nr:hypothetical protein [Phycisphaerae bacterium]